MLSDQPKCYLFNERMKKGRVTNITEEWNMDVRNHPWCWTSLEIYSICSLPAWLLSHLGLLHLFSHIFPHPVKSSLLPSSISGSILPLPRYLHVQIILFWKPLCTSVENFQSVLSHILVPRQNNIFWLKQNMVNLRLKSCPNSAAW